MTQPTGPETPWMTSQQVCDWLQIKPNWLYARVSAHEIPNVKIGGVLRFNRSELEAWIEVHRRGRP